MGALEVAIRRFWKTSLAWKGKNGFDEGISFGDVIDELSALKCYRGQLGLQASILLDDIVSDRRLRAYQESLVYEWPMPTIASVPVLDEVAIEAERLTY